MTGESGRAHVPALAVGSYAMRAELDAFRPVTIDDITIELGTAVELRLTLHLASLGETIDVIAPVPLLDIQRTVVSTVISERQIAGLPIDRRNYISFAVLAGGVGTDRTLNQGPAETSGLTFAGQSLAANLGWDIFLVSLNSAGTVLWRHTAGGPGHDMAGEALINSANDLVTSGFIMESTSLTFNLGEASPVTIAGSADATSFVVKYNSFGVYQWSQVAGSVDLPAGETVEFGDAFGASIGTLRLDSSNNVYLGGVFAGLTNPLFGGTSGILLPLPIRIRDPLASFEEIHRRIAAKKRDPLSNATPEIAELATAGVAAIARTPLGDLALRPSRVHAHPPVMAEELAQLDFRDRVALEEFFNHLVKYTRLDTGGTPNAGGIVHGYSGKPESDDKQSGAETLGHADCRNHRVQGKNNI